MSNDKYDAETTQAIAEAEALEAMFQSSGWQVAERSLNAITGALRDARSIDVNREDVALQIKVNVAIAENLEEWVNDLRGRINNVIILKQEVSNGNLVTRR